MAKSRRESGFLVLALNLACQQIVTVNLPVVTRPTELHPIVFSGEQGEIEMCTKVGKVSVATAVVESKY